VFTCRDAAEVHELFRVVNSNRPIPRFLLDETETVALAIREHVRCTYPAFVSGSARPNVPNVNLDAFTQAVIDKYGSAVGADAGAWIDARNAEHKEMLATLRVRYERVASGVAAIEREYKSAAKSKGARFYLGCYWLDAPRNAALSKPLRAMVWRSWYATVPHDANGDAMCPCCGSARISALEAERTSAVRDVQHLDGNARLRRVPRGAPRRVRLFCLGCESPRLFASFFFRENLFVLFFCFFHDTAIL
jgi:hypothetical protein